jgi:hypothetical protein
VFYENLKRGKYATPVLERSWEIVGIAYLLISDVDGVYTHKTSLPEKVFEHLLAKPKYAPYAGRIEESESKIGLTEDGAPFEDISRCFFKAGLTWDDFSEACELAGKETPVTPYTHDAINNICNDKKPPSITLAFDSASFNESLISFSQNKRLPVSVIEGSWLEFHKGKYTGRYFFNYGINKLVSGNRILAKLNCIPNVVVSRKKTEVITFSDTKRPDKYFREFVGLGGISLWADKTVGGGLQTAESDILEMNIPETLDDMRIFTYPIKHLFRSQIITMKNPPQDLDTASKSAKQLIALGRECIESTDEKLFGIKLGEFMSSTPDVLALLSKFDFPRYSTGIDLKYLELLAERSMKEKKETISDILDMYTDNFPESLAENGWLSGLAQARDFT